MGSRPLLGHGPAEQVAAVGAPMADNRQISSEDQRSVKLRVRSPPTGTHQCHRVTPTGWAMMLTVKLADRASARPGNGDGSLRSAGARHRPPFSECSPPQQTMMRGPEQMAADSEEILDERVHRQEALGVSCRFEPTHLALSLTRRFVRHLGVVVRIPFREMGHRRHGRPTRSSVTLQLVGDQPGRGPARMTDDLRRKAVSSIVRCTVAHRHSVPSATAT